MKITSSKANPRTYWTHQTRGREPPPPLDPVKKKTSNTLMVMAPPDCLLTSGCVCGKGPTGKESLSQGLQFDLVAAVDGT